MLLLWGAGGHGKVLAEVARAAGFDVVGFADADVAKLGSARELSGALVVAAEAELLAALAAGEELPGGADCLAVAIGDNARRLACVERAASVALPTIVHPSAVVSPSARLGAATVVFPAAVVNADARIGRGVIVNTGAIVEHDCRLNDGVHISPGAVVAGGVAVGERSWIGAGATVIPGVTIGRDALIGAGAVVVRDVPDGVVVVGVPARPLRRTGQP